MDWTRKLAKFNKHPDSILLRKINSLLNSMVLVDDDFPLVSIVVRKDFWFAFKNNSGTRAIISYFDFIYHPINGKHTRRIRGLGGGGESE